MVVHLWVWVKRNGVLLRCLAVHPWCCSVKYACRSFLLKAPFCIMSLKAAFKLGTTTLLLHVERREGDVCYSVRRSVCEWAQHEGGEVWPMLSSDALGETQQGGEEWIGGKEVICLSLSYERHAIRDRFNDVLEWNVLQLPTFVHSTEPWFKWFGWYFFICLSKADHVSRPLIRKRVEVCFWRFSLKFV